jgi:hypothetical protein
MYTHRPNVGSLPLEMNADQAGDVAALEASASEIDQRADGAEADHDAADASGSCNTVPGIDWSVPLPSSFPARHVYCAHDLPGDSCHAAHGSTVTAHGRLDPLFSHSQQTLSWETFST